MIENDFSKTSGFDPRADARADRLIDLFDVMVVVLNWGNTYQKENLMVYSLYLFYYLLNNAIYINIRCIDY